MNTETSQPLDMYVECSIDGKTYKGRVIGTTLQEARAEFVLDTDPEFHVTQSVPLVFQSPALPRPLPARATVVQAAGGDGRQTYNFRLTDATTAAVRTLFNRRGALRLWPAPGRPILVRVKAAGSTFLARVKDLSVSGMGFAASLEDEVNLRKQASVGLTFTPFGSKRELEVVAKVRHSSLLDNSIVYGVEFDAEATPNFSDVSEEIFGWVRRRELEIIRAAHDAADQDA